MHRHHFPRRRALALALGLTIGTPSQGASLEAQIDRLAERLESRVIEHRRHFHQYPELSNREVNTAARVADTLRELGYSVETGIAHTGVVGVLVGGQPGPVVALRADMDALPVTEEVDLPFRSTARSRYDGQEVGVMHACGHDAHMAILLGVAEIAASLQDQWPGTLKLIFQPAEEGAPKGEEGGAALMVKEGVLSQAPKPAVIFGLHALSLFETGQLGTRAQGLMASSDSLEILVKGRQTHGAVPWGGIDPIVVSAQIINALQTIPSRQMDATQAPVIVTIGRIDGGVRGNIIPDQVRMVGTLRALDEAMRADLHRRVRLTAESIATAAGATVEVRIGEGTPYPVTYNDPALTRQMQPTLQRVAGAGYFEARPIMGAEDFSYFQREIPGLYLFLGVRDPKADPAEYPANHSPRFRIDESALRLGVRALAHLARDYAGGQAP